MQSSYQMHLLCDMHHIAVPADSGSWRHCSTQDLDIEAPLIATGKQTRLWSVRYLLIAMHAVMHIR